MFVSMTLLYIILFYSVRRSTLSEIYVNTSARLSLQRYSFWCRQLPQKNFLLITFALVSMLVGERRRRTDWRVRELVGATDSFLALGQQSPSTVSATINTTLPDFQDRIQLNSVFFMGHSFGGATALTAAHRRPDLLGSRGGTIAHEPAVDWMPDDARSSLLPVDKLSGLSPDHAYAGGTGGFDVDVSNLKSDSPSIHDRHLLLLFSNEWRQLVSSARIMKLYLLWVYHILLLICT